MPEPEPEDIEAAEAVPSARYDVLIPVDKHDLDGEYKGAEACTFCNRLLTRPHKKGCHVLEVAQAIANARAGGAAAMREAAIAAAPEVRPVPPIADGSFINHQKAGWNQCRLAYGQAIRALPLPGETP